MHDPSGDGERTSDRWRVCDVNELTEEIIGAAIAVHRELGPGLLETTYQRCLAAELRHRGLRVEQQVRVPLIYRDLYLDCGYRIDLLVEGRVVVEVKVAARLIPVHVSQVLTYLRLRGLQTGLLLNFDVPVLRAGGIKRIVWGRDAPQYRRPGGWSSEPESGEETENGVTRR